MGAKRERELVNFVEAHGWGAMRSGGSGSGTKRELPDIIAGDGGTRYWGIEEKYSGQSKQIYIKEKKAKELVNFCTRMGLRPMAAARYSTHLDGVTEADWRIAPLEKAPETDGGNLKLNHSIVKDWPLLSNIV